jgi:Domain of unknown function (DUF4211)
MRLQFTPLPSSSPSKKEYADSVQNRLANVRFNGAEERQSRTREMAAIPTPEPSSQTPSELSKDIGNTAGQDEEDDKIELPAAKRHRTSSNKPCQTTRTPRRSSRLLHQTPSYESPSFSTSSSSSLRFHSVEIPSPTPSRRTRPARSESAVVHSSPPVRTRTALSSLGSPETSGDDDDVLVTKPAQRRRPGKPVPVRDDFVVPDDESIATSANEEDAPVTPIKRRKSRSLNQTPRTRRLESRREHQELKEDLEDLQDSDSPQLQTSRTRGAPVNRERERRRAYIELLKRRRAGERVPIQIDTDDDEDLDVDYSSKHNPNGSAAFCDRQTHNYSGESSEEDDLPQNPALDVDEDDFVVADEEEAPVDRLDRPHPDIPLEFTSYASAKPRELFVYVIEWLVKNKIAPAFSRHDQLWRLAFTKIKDEITAQTSSRLKSSAWTGSFAKALSARPALMTAHLLPGESSMHGCDACNKQNRPAQYDFVFSGSAYHHDSLEPIDPESSSEGEAGHDDASVDSRGHPVPPADTHFLLGRYCAANAELAHKFTHWKYNLNESLMGYLESQGVLSAEEIVRRERAKGGQRKREKEAEEIVDQMKATGVIEDLWKGFKDDLDDARIGMEGYERKGGRGNQRIGSVKVPVREVTMVEEEDGGEKPEARNFGPRVGKEAPKVKTLASDDEGE